MSLVEDTWYEECPLCGGGDTLVCMDGTVQDDCPACEDGLVPHAHQEVEG